MDEIISFLAEKFGLDFSGENEKILKPKVLERMKRLGISSPKEYLSIIKDYSKELERLLELVLVKETYFFREEASFKALKEIAKAIKGYKNIVSAGCSTGEEVWSICMTLLEDEIKDFFVWGFDLSREAIDTARKGIYHPMQVRSVPEHKFKFLEKTENAFRVKDILRKYIYFFVGNILEVMNKLPLSDIIFMRNVLIYLTDYAKEEVLKLTYDRMKSGGYLFLSSSENLLDIYPAFEPEFLPAPYIAWRKP